MRADPVPICLLPRNVTLKGRKIYFRIDLETLAKLLKVVRKFLIEIPDACSQRISQPRLLGSADFSRPPILVGGKHRDDRDHHNNRDHFYAESLLPHHRVSISASLKIIGC